MKQAPHQVARRCRVPDWRQVDPQPLGLVLLKEQIPASNEILAIFGQDAAFRILQAAILGALHADRSGGQDARIFALFGRFGQGKTRILAQIAEWLDGKSTESQGWLFPRRVHVFKVSEYSQQDVPAAFDAFLGRKNLLVRSGLGFLFAVAGAIFVTLCLIGALSFAGWFVGVDTTARLVGNDAAKSLFGLVLTAAVSLFSGISIWRFWKRDAERYINFSDAQSLCRLIIDTFQRGDVLLIDDFDRATSDQQTAMLWTLRRRRESLRMIVIIAFDETPLLRGEQGDSALELLEKTFDVAVRLNPITRQDAIHMAAGFARQLCRANPRCSAAQLLGDPLVVGDLARIFLLLGRASARFSKSFANRLLAAAQQLRLQVPEDMSALARIQGLYELVPWLESDAEHLADILSRNDAEAFLLHVEARRGGPLQNHIRNSVKRYVEGTSRLQPALGNWDRVLALWTSVDLDEVGASTDIDVIKLGTRFYEDWTGNSKEAAQRRRHDFLLKWLSWDLAILAERRPLERRTIYRLCRKSIGCFVDPAFTGPVEQHSEAAVKFLPTATEILLWLYLLDRTRIADAELPREEMRSVAFPADELSGDAPASLREEASNAWRRLPLVYQHVPLSLPERVELASFALPDRGMGPAMARLFAQSRVDPLDSFTLPADRRVFGLKSSGLKHLERRSYLERYWPTFDDNDAQTHFRALAVLAPWRTIAPRAHRLWLFEKAEMRQGDAIFSALRELLPRPEIGAETKHWPLEILRALLAGRTADEFPSVDYIKVAQALAEGVEFSAKHRAEEILFLLASTEEQKIIDEALSKPPPAGFDLNWLRALGALRGDKPSFALSFDLSSWRGALDIFLEEAMKKIDRNIGEVTAGGGTNADLSLALFNLDKLRAIAALWAQ